MLTNAAAKAAGAKNRSYKLSDQGGMHLLVRPTGTKSWQQKYRWRGREKLLTLGQFPDVSVPRARILQAGAKEMLDRGVDPSSAASKAGSLDTFEQLARSWYQHSRASWSAAHAADVIGSLERDILPDLGERPVSAISAPELLALLRAVEKRGRLTTAQRIRQRLSEIFAFAIAQGLVENDPAAKLGAAMKDAPPAQPHPALIGIHECRALLRACDDVRAQPVTLAASRFLALTAVRLDAVRGARWSEIDLGAATWTVPASRMKLARAKKGNELYNHIVPLSGAAMDVLSSQLNNNPVMSSGDGLVFPGRSGDQPIGEGAIRELYIRAGYSGRHVPHGWRASFSTILNEELGEGSRTTIDMALAHSAKGKVEAAYNRAQLLGSRRELMDRWGAMLLGQEIPHT
jgi:integrase